MVGIELDQTVAGGADEAGLRLRDRPVESDVDGLRVIAVGGVRRGVRIVGDGHRVAGRGVDRCRVGAAVATPATTVAVDGRVEAQVQREWRTLLDEALQRDVEDDRVAVGVGEVVGNDLVQAALRRLDDAALHSARIERLHRVRHVARLQVGERRTVGDDVLQGLDVGVVDRRVIDVAEQTARNRVPDLRGRVTRGAKAVLASEIEVGERTRPVRRGTRCTRCSPTKPDQHDRACECTEGEPPPHHAYEPSPCRRDVK